MTLGIREVVVSLEDLDGYLKALLKLKLREFVHLSPWFKNVSLRESLVHKRFLKSSEILKLAADNHCPHQQRQLLMQQRKAKRLLRKRLVVRQVSSAKH